MSRKLSPEELERFKTDFDPPAYMDPQTKKKLPVRKETEQPKTKGRPRKHDDTRPVSFRLPEKTIRRLRAKAALEGVSPADLIIAWANTLEVVL